MPKHLQREIENLKRMLLALSAVVEENVFAAVDAIQQRDAEMARRVLNTDAEIDEMEVQVEEECLRILALHKPVAFDLRFVIAVLKINNELERIGDLAVNIAERAFYLCSQPPLAVPLDFSQMAERVQSMLRRALNALVNLDTKLAVQITKEDDLVDKIHREMYTFVQEGIRADLEKLGSYIHLLSVSKHLERIADLATNISEEVIYMIDGKIVRHRLHQYREQGGAAPEDV
jgi:phosphate transport system protein